MHDPEIFLDEYGILVYSDEQTNIYGQLVAILLGLTSPIEC